MDEILSIGSSVEFGSNLQNRPSQVLVGRAEGANTNSLTDLNPALIEANPLAGLTLNVLPAQASGNTPVNIQELSPEELQALEDAMVDMVFEAGVYSLLFHQILAQVMELSMTDVVNEAMDLYG